MMAKLMDTGGETDETVYLTGNVQRTLALLTCFLVILLDGFNTTSVSFVVPRLAHEWGLVPARFTPVFVATNVGALIGYVVIGPLAQRIGYRAAGVASVVLFGGFTFLGVFSTNIAMLSVLRLIASIGLGSVLPTAITASTSIMGPKHKIAASLLVTTGMSVGSVTGGITGGPLMQHLGWQSIFIVGGLLPFVLTVPFFRVLSPALCAELAGGRDQASRAGGKLRSLFCDARAGYTLLLWLFAFLVFMDIYGLLFWIPTLLPSFGFSAAKASSGIAAFSLGGLSGNVIMTVAVTAMVLAGRVRLKSALTIGIVLVMVGVLVLGRVQLSGPAVLLMIGVIGAGLINCIMGLTALAVAFYPTDMRATGVGWGHAIGRIGSFVGPSISGALLSMGWPARDIVLTATLPAAAAIVTLGALGLAGRTFARRQSSQALAPR
ncbi:MFS transporter [Paraburkholderia metrosideri]|uniref:MFS transporter n=1 Tax=Paraburkholderia metrosideri TaxID=580937 RepID=A0ABW9DW71_9BURK